MMTLEVGSVCQANIESDMLNNIYRRTSIFGRVYPTLIKQLCNA